MVALGVPGQSAACTSKVLNLRHHTVTGFTQSQASYSHRVHTVTGQSQASKSQASHSHRLLTPKFKRGWLWLLTPAPAPQTISFTWSPAAQPLKLVTEINWSPGAGFHSCPIRLLCIVPMATVPFSALINVWSTVPPIMQRTLISWLLVEYVKHRHTHTHMHTYTDTCIHTNKHICMHTHTHICTKYTLMHMFTQHTQTLAHTHITDRCKCTKSNSLKILVQKSTVVW